MRKILAIAVMLVSSSVGAFCWNCSNPLAERVVVPSGTSGSYGDADGQLALFNGLLYECKVVPPSVTPTATAPNSTSTSSSTSGASSNATGGNATSTAGVSNSGNSTNTNKNTLTNTNTLAQRQQQSNSSTNNNASTATGNGDNANNSTEVTNIKPAAASAVAPIGFPTAPCLATFGGAAQSIPGGISFGGSRVDKGCDSRATAQQFALLLNNRVAAAKILCTTKAARRAHLTIEDCLAFVPAPVAIVPPRQLPRLSHSLNPCR